MKASTFWDVTVPRLMSTNANVVFAMLWIGFIAALLVNRQWLDQLWYRVQGLPIVPRTVIWVVLTPVMTLLWVWQSSWSPLGRAAGFAGVILWTLVAVSSLVKAFR